MPPARPQTVHPLSIPFVGRERERAEIGAALSVAAGGGRGKLFLVRGEPGVGKTRLVEEVARDAEARGLVVAWGESQDAAGAPAYWPWTQVLRSAGEQIERPGGGVPVSSGPEFLARILPEAGGGETSSAEGAPGSPDERFRLFEAVTSFLASLASLRPLLLVIEDLHATDLASLLLFQFAARELRQAPVVLIGTFREPGPRLDREHRSVLARTGAEGATIPLRLLTKSEVGRLAAAVLGDELPEDFVRSLFEATGGNALLVDGTLRTFPNERTKPDSVGIARLALSGEASETIGKWIDYLAPPAREAVEAAAVLGGDVALGRVAALLDRSLDDADELLDEARDRGLVTRPSRSPLRVRFRHGLIRETLYEALPPDTRRDLHQRAAAILERDDADPAELAHHFLRATPLPGAARKAISFSRDAARRSSERLAWEDAVVHVRHALEALRLDGDDPPTRCELLLELGEALSRAGDFAEARRTFAEAFSLARDLDATALMGRAAIGHYGPVGRSLNDPESGAMIREVLERLGEGDLELRALLLGRLVLAEFHGSSAATSLALAPQALEAARNSANPAVIAESLMTVWPVLTSDPSGKGRLAAATELRDLGIRHGKVDWQQWGRVYCFLGHVESADLARATEEMQAATRAAEDFRQPFWRFGATVLRTMLAGIAGRFTECLELVDEAARHGRGAPELSGPICVFQRAFVALDLDRPEDLEAVIRLLTPNDGNDRAALVRFRWEAGNREAAARELEALAPNRFEAVRGQINWTSGVSVLAPACAGLGDESSAAALYEMLLPCTDQIVCAGLPGYWAMGPVAFFLGILARTAGQEADAERHLAASHEISTRIGARPWVAHTRVEQARLSARRGDRDAAAAHLDEARRIALALGMKRLLRTIAEL